MDEETSASSGTEDPASVNTKCVESKKKCVESVRPASRLGARLCARREGIGGPHAAASEGLTALRLLLCVRALGCAGRYASIIAKRKVKMSSIYDMDFGDGGVLGLSYSVALSLHSSLPLALSLSPSLSAPHPDTHTSSDTHAQRCSR